MAVIESETVQLMRATGYRLPPVQTFCFANSDVSRVWIVNRERGTLHGAVAGSLVGLALGATTETPLWEGAANLETAAFLCLVVGIIVGSVAGTYVASPTNVRFAPPASATSQQ
jgi:hypothetical protein